MVEKQKPARQPGRHCLSAPRTLNLPCFVSNLFIAAILCFLCNFFGLMKANRTKQGVKGVHCNTFGGNKSNIGAHFFFTVLVKFVL